MSYSENNTFEKILQRCLSNELLENIDKRAGSIIYDTLAPVCMELAEAYVKMDILEEQTYLMTATGNNLDKRVYDYGVKRTQATKALRIGEFKKYQVDGNGDFILDENENKILIDMDIDIDSRFMVPDSKLTFKYIGKINNLNILECEQDGIDGNEPYGTIFPIIPISDLITANITSTYKPAENRETDDELRARTLSIIRTTAFGGNIADYIEKVNAIDGVGNTKVFPAWQQNGSVLLSVVDPSYNPITAEFIRNLKEQIDPEESTGQGIGIAPIGHYVTITTPVRQNVKISFDVELEENYTVGNVQSEIETLIENYFVSVRKSFGQDSILAIYRARISETVLKCPQVLNVTNILLNDVDADVVYNDQQFIGEQYLPYISEVIING